MASDRDLWRGLPHEPRRPGLAERLRYAWYMRPRFDPPLSRFEKWTVAGFAFAAGLAGYVFGLILLDPGA